MELRFRPPELFPQDTAFQLCKTHKEPALTSLSLDVRERRSTNDEEVALPEAEHSLVTVVVGRGMSREAGREPRGENAPVSLLGLMSSGAPLPSLNKHGGGTEMRGSEWIPRGEPEDSGGAVFFIGCVFFSARAARGQQRKRKKGPERKGVFDGGALPRCTLIYLFSPFSSWSSALFRPCARRSIARASGRQLPSMPCLPLELLPARGQRQMLRKFY